MRADRLVATLLILQSRGRVSAAELARELEVSVKTARRDLEALAIAGVPVYAQPGRNGGWSLLGGARTDLSGLTADEARTLFLLAGPSARVAPEAKAALSAIVMDTYGWFRGLVAQRRGMDEAQLNAVADGRVFSGRQSVPLKLVDELGDERQAVAWLEKERNVPAKLPVKDWKPKAEGGLKLWSSLGTAADLAGFDGLAARLRAVGDEATALGQGGLLALWRPAP